MASKQQVAWLKTMVTPAQVTQQQFGVPASVTLAQAIFESTWGESQLCRKANNYFGIKALQGEDYVEFPTHEVIRGRSLVELADFARYPSAIESFAAHGKLLATLSRYKPVMAALPDVDTCCKQLRTCGYSTNPDYAHLLIDEIDYRELRKYDLLPQPPAQAKEAA